MNKEAFMGGLLDKLKAKFSDPTFTHEKAIPVLDSIFSHHTGTGLAGAGLGSLIGAALPGKKRKEGWGESLKRRLTNAAKGAGIGGAAGLAGSFVAPEVSSMLNDKLVSNTIRKPLGYLLTNNIAPRSYNDPSTGTALSDKFFQSEGFMTPEKKKEIWKLMKTMGRNAYEDQPASWLTDQQTDLNTGDVKTLMRDPARYLLYRKSFDLPIRPSDAEGYKYLMPHGSKILYEPSGTSGVPILANSTDWEMNTHTPGGKAWFNRVFGNPENKDILEGRNAAKAFEDKNNLDSLSVDNAAAPEVMGNYVLSNKLINDPAGSAEKVPALHLRDPWDFDLHKDQALDSKGNWMRYFINKIINPQTVAMDVTGDRAFPNAYANAKLAPAVPKGNITYRAGIDG